jgi:tetratricopeptide (TPR) repeat protein
VRTTTSTRVIAGLSIWFGITGATGVATAQTTSDEQWAATFADYDISMARGDLQRAAGALVEIIDDESLTEFHGDALLNLGNTVSDIGLPYGALLSYSSALTQEEPVTAAVEKAINASEVVRDFGLLQGLFGDNVGIEGSPEEQSEMAWLAALDNFRSGNLSVTLGILAIIPTDAAAYPKAQHLKGIVLAQQGRYNDSLAPLMTAFAMMEDQSDMDLVNINLGRSYFGAGNFARAIEYFALVERGSPHWLEAQFERAWAHFRLEDVSGAVALLLTHMSPFFDTRYYPEAELLDTYSLFLLCKFPAATERIEHFRDSYRPIHDALASALENMSDSDLFFAVTGGANQELPTRVFLDLYGEPRLQDAAAAVTQAETEIERVRSVSNARLSEYFVEILQGRRDAIVAAEGSRIRGVLSGRLEALNNMLADTEMARLDILRLETRLYERAAGAGEMEEARNVAQRQLRIPPGHLSWPFQGEFWADELGYYRVNAISECPESMQVGIETEEEE